jgi:RES domain-containing protein
VRLWRISKFADLSGQGGLVASARWHRVGRRVVYLADHPASALLEIIVAQNLDRRDLPDRYQLLAIELPDRMTFVAVTESDLPENWQGNREVTRTIGNKWLDSRESALLRVPSAIVPFAFNWLLNPTHGDARQVTIAEVIQADLDVRLAGRV